MSQHNRAQYLAWLRGNAPSLYRDCVPQMSVEDVTEYQSLSGFWDSVGTTFNSVVSNVTNALPQLANTYSQYESNVALIKLNTQRAASGQAPLQYQNGQLVTSAGLPYTPEEFSLAGTGMGTVAVVGGLGLIAVLLFMRGRGRRK